MPRDCRAGGNLSSGRDDYFNNHIITLAYLWKDYLKTKSNKSSLDPTLCGFVQAEEHLQASEAGADRAYGR